ncbi:MAG: nicotinamide riboside transporter PnuC, partial [Bacteroidales bacterium]
MMDLFSLSNTLFVFFGQPVSLIETLSVASGLLCVFLATRGRVANFWVGYLYNIVLFILFYQKGLYSSMILQPIAFTINLFGHYRWTHPKEGEVNERALLKVSILSAGSRVRFVAQIVVVTLVWGAILSRLHLLLPSLFNQAQRPLLDAFVTITALTAQYLSAQKKLECWIGWFTVNITNFTLY